MTGQPEKWTFSRSISFDNILTLLVISAVMLSSVFRLEGKVEVNTNDIAHNRSDIAEVKGEWTAAQRETNRQLERINDKLDAKADKALANQR